MIIGIIGIVYIGIGVIISALAAFMFMQETKQLTDDEFVAYLYDDEESRTKILTAMKASTARTLIELASPLCNCIAWPYLVYRFVKVLGNG